ncbi:hypothetical protein BN1708_019143, partial [Verticillium longisporum]
GPRSAMLQHCLQHQIHPFRGCLPDRGQADLHPDDEVPIQRGRPGGPQDGPE